ncbi:MAG: hypothetical protein ACLGI6_19550 [Gammaproteobacteria bacterium]
MQQLLKLSSALDRPGVSAVLDALVALPGVDTVRAVSGANIVEVSFDRRQTSRQQMGAVLARIGYPEKQSRSIVRTAQL